MQQRWLPFVAIWVTCIAIAMHFSWNVFPNYHITIWIVSLSGACIGTAVSYGFSWYEKEASRFRADYAELQGDDEAVKVSNSPAYSIIQISIVASQFVPDGTCRTGSLVTEKPELWIASST